MQFRFQEPDTDIEAVVYEVTARLEDQVARAYVKQGQSKWARYASRDSHTPVEWFTSQNEALDKTRERMCREVKATILDAAARKVRGGHAA